MLLARARCASLSMKGILQSGLVLAGVPVQPGLAFAATEACVRPAGIIQRGKAGLSLQTQRECVYKLRLQWRWKP